MDSTAVSGAAGSGSIPDGCNYLISYYIFVINHFVESATLNEAV